MEDYAGISNFGLDSFSEKNGKNRGRYSSEFTFRRVCVRCVFPLFSSLSFRFAKSAGIFDGKFFTLFLANHFNIVVSILTSSYG